MRRSTAVLAVVAGLAFALFPLLRPWGDTAGTDAAMAEAFASPRWVLAHTSGMLGFATLAAAAATTARSATGRATAWLLAAGTAAALPFFGAETFGLHALGQAAVAAGDPALVAPEALVRSGPTQLTLFGLGLLAVAAGGVLLAVDAWRAVRPRWSGIPAAVLLALYLPQFFLAPGARTAHGVLLGAAIVVWGLRAAVIAARRPVPIA